MARKILSTKVQRIGSKNVVFVRYMEDGQRKSQRADFDGDDKEGMQKFITNFSAAADKSPDTNGGGGGQ